jgi:hypothetical protein
VLLLRLRTFNLYELVRLLVLLLSLGIPADIDISAWISTELPDEDDMVISAFLRKSFDILTAKCRTQQPQHQQQTSTTSDDNDNNNDNNNNGNNSSRWSRETQARSKEAKGGDSTYSNSEL